jgi:hypothetical protein
VTLILDAFNILHAWHSSPSGDTWTEITALAALTRRGPWGRNEAVLVCDGPSPDRDRDQLEVGPGVVAVFAGIGSDADSVIEALIEGSHAPSRVTVVSSDRRVEKAARRRGCRSVTSQEFLRAALGAPRSGPTEASPPDGLDGAEIDRWMRAFGVDPGPGSRAPREKPSPEKRLLDGARIDPEELDMERWLRTHPPPDPGVEPRGRSD